MRTCVVLGGMEIGTVQQVERLTTCGILACTLFRDSLFPNRGALTDSMTMEAHTHLVYAGGLKQMGQKLKLLRKMEALTLSVRNLEV